MEDTPEIILQRIRENNKVRSKNHYDWKKLGINYRRRVLYAIQHNNPIPPMPAGLANEQRVIPIEQHRQRRAPAPIVPQPEPEEQPPQPPVRVATRRAVAPIVEAPAPQPPVRAARRKGRPPAIVVPAHRVVTEQDVLDRFEELNYKKDTFKSYKNNLRQLMRVTECPDLAECLKHHVDMIRKVKTGKTVETKNKPSRPYSVSGIRDIFQVILIIIDQMKLNINKKPYDDEFQIYKIKVNDEKAQRQENEDDAVYTFAQYLNLVKTKFGETSKEYLLSLMYDELTVRDDYVLKIINNKNDALADDTINYIVVSGNKDIQVILYKYKTSDKYGVIEHKYKPMLSNRIRTYITSKKLKVGDYLFGKTELSAFINKMNKKIDKEIKGGVNNMRHMKVSDELKNVASADERFALATKMKHSPVTQLWYVRKHKIT